MGVVTAENERIIMFAEYMVLRIIGISFLQKVFIFEQLFCACVCVWLLVSFAQTWVDTWACVSLAFLACFFKYDFLCLCEFVYQSVALKTDLLFQT